MPETPASLLQRLREPGATRAWDEFVALYSPLLFHWARRAGLQEADATDPRKGFRNWLRTVTLNKWRERRRKQATAPPVVPDAALDEVLAPPGEEPFWETEYRQLLSRRLLELMQAEFQPATWKACWETIVAGRSAADVGKELNLSPGAVRAAKFRVLCRLRTELDGLLD